MRQQERFEAIGRLAGGIAHDFNNIVGAILGWAQLGEEEAGNESRQKDRFRQIRHQAERASRTYHPTAHFRPFASAAAGETRFKQINFRDAQLPDEWNGRQYEFKTVLDPHLDIIESDASQISQVTMNLCINARDAMSRQVVI